jgi:hypothetical protein
VFTPLRAALGGLGLQSNRKTRQNSAKLDTRDDNQQPCEEVRGSLPSWPPSNMQLSGRRVPATLPGYQGCHSWLPCQGTSYAASNNQHHALGGRCRHLLWQVPWTWTATALANHSSEQRGALERNQQDLLRSMWILL